MTWLEGTEVDTTPPGRRLVALLERPQVLGAPGAVNALAGLLAKRAGFEALYISGGALTASLGLPDLGIIGLDELCANVRSIHRATGLPLIVDTDTGYGGVLNTMRAVRELENAGAAAIHIEDQQLPKKCGHLNDKRLVPAEEAAAKIAAAVRARTHMRIIARTDAAAESLDEAIRRGRLYRSAGADIVFPDALRSAEEFRSFANGVGGMLMANMTEFGRTPYFNANEFFAMGYGIVIWPVSALRVAAKAMEGLYAHLYRHGTPEGMLASMQSRAELYDLIGYGDYEALDAAVAQSVLPEVGR